MSGPPSLPPSFHRFLIHPSVCHAHSHVDYTKWQHRQQTSKNKWTVPHNLSPAADSFFISSQMFVVSSGWDEALLIAAGRQSKWPSARSEKNKQGRGRDGKSHPTRDFVIRALWGPRFRTRRPLSAAPLGRPSSSGENSRVLLQVSSDLKVQLFTSSPPEPGSVGLQALDGTLCSACCSDL